MSKDTAKEQPVDNIADDISAVLDAADEATDEKEQSETAEETAEMAVEKEGAGDDSDGKADSKQDSDAETPEESGELESGESDESEESDEDDLAASETEEPDKLDPPQHWAAADKELFSSQTREAQEWLLERHKSMEGDYTRKSQEIASIQRQYDAIKDALSPYEQEFARAGLDQAGAVRKLASVHHALKTDGKSAILALARTYGIDLKEEDQQHVDPALRKTQSQLSQIEQRIARQERAAQQERQQALLGVIQSFETEKDESGNLKHPHFKTLQGDITALFNAGLAKDLEEGYGKALSMRPDLQTQKTVSKVSQAEKVRKAKKAATGIKSSGAVGKTRRVMSLEEEIAAQIP